MDPRAVMNAKDRLEIVDVRETYEWRAGRIEGAKNIPMAELPGRLDEIGPGTVVVVCRSGSRSDRAAEFLRAKGFDAHSMQGGMVAWARAGLPFTTPDGRPGEVAR